MTEYKEQRDERQERQKGFTLIELMIVVAIIAILAAVAIPNFLRARDRSRISACLSQMVNMGTAAQDYIVEKGSLASLPGWEDLCVHIYAGAEVTTDCDTKLDAKIKKVCADDGSFAYNQIDDFTYEFQATARDKGGCFVCVTENMAVPSDDRIPICDETCTH
jgi:prepilin-type N-terminal cleavage/methylation domain-containing protein